MAAAVTTAAGAAAAVITVAAAVAAVSTGIAINRHISNEQQIGCSLPFC
jgi:hypothetical protein